MMEEMNEVQKTKLYLAELWERAQVDVEAELLLGSGTIEVKDHEVANFIRSILDAEEVE